MSKIKTIRCRSLLAIYSLHNTVHEINATQVKFKHLSR